MIHKKNQRRIFDKEGKFKNIRNVPDVNALGKGLEFACKLKKKYKEDDTPRHNLNLTDEQLDRILKD